MKVRLVIPLDLTTTFAQHREALDRLREDGIAKVDYDALAIVAEVEYKPDDPELEPSPALTMALAEVTGRILTARMVMDVAIAQTLIARWEELRGWLATEGWQPSSVEFVESEAD